MTDLKPSPAATPRITRVQVIPVAGHDGMLLNLSGAHGPFFTRNLLVLTDSSGRTGVGEVPGGEKIRNTLEDARPLIEGQSLGNWNHILNSLRTGFADRDSGGRGNQTFDMRVTIPGRRPPADRRPVAGQLEPHPEQPAHSLCRTRQRRSRQPDF